MAKKPCGSVRESHFGKADRANEDHGKESGPKHPALFLERKGGGMIVEPKLRLSHHARRKRDGKPSILA
jgi:hypothetical protein